MGRSDLAIVIPCYNEAATLAGVIGGCTLFGDVYVVDDGSTDGSNLIAEREGATVVFTGGRTGYDRVIERGLREAFDRGYKYVVTIDGDGEHDPKVVGEYAKLFREEHVGLICGIRPAPQRLAEWVVCLYCRLRFGVKDILCGMKGYSREALECYFADGHPNVVNTWPALMWMNAGKPFRQVVVTGRRRTDQPRFSSRYRANIAIFKMLGPIRSLKRG